MRDPNLIDLQQERIPQDWRRNYLERPIARLPKDMITAFDMMWKLQREKDDINARLLKAQRRLERAGWKMWTLGIIVTGEGVVIGWAVKFLLEHFR